MKRLAAAAFGFVLLFIIPWMTTIPYATHAPKPKLSPALTSQIQSSFAHTGWAPAPPPLQQIQEFSSPTLPGFAALSTIERFRGAAHNVFSDRLACLREEILTNPHLVCDLTAFLNDATFQVPDGLMTNTRPPIILQRMAAIDMLAEVASGFSAASADAERALQDLVWRPINSSLPEVVQRVLLAESLDAVQALIHFNPINIVGQLVDKLGPDALTRFRVPLVNGLLNHGIDRAEVDPTLHELVSLYRGTHSFLDPGRGSKELKLPAE